MRKIIYITLAVLILAGCSATETPPPTPDVVAEAEAQAAIIEAVNNGVQDALDREQARRISELENMSVINEQVIDLMKMLSAKLMLTVAEIFAGFTILLLLAIFLVYAIFANKKRAHDWEMEARQNQLPREVIVYHVAGKWRASTGQGQCALPAGWDVTSEYAEVQR